MNLKLFIVFTLFVGILILNNSCNKTTTDAKAPTVLFTVTPSNGTTSTEFVFDASETVDSYGSSSNLMYKWDFENDGFWDTEWQTTKTQTHQYESEGYFTVGLLVKDSYGLTAWASRNLTVGAGGGSGPGYPIANFTISPPEGSVGTEFTFDASSVSDAENQQSDLEVRWDFKDDGWDTDWSVIKTTTHSYDIEGNYKVLMEVKDLDGNISSTSKTLIVNSVINLDFVEVQGGSFEMGCNGSQIGLCENDELPSHTVTLNSFKISKYEITNELFAQFLNSVGCSPDGYLNNLKYIHIESDTCQIKYNGSEFYALDGMDQRAAIFITWFGAKAFCEWVGGRLPTEAEWEYAARGGNVSNGYKYSGGNNINVVAWYSDNSQQVNHDIGTKEPNELGIYDMSGNAREWCSDWFDYYYYETSPSDNPVGPSSGEYRVLRGGSFFVQSANSRVSDRYWGLEVNTFYRYEVGFRVAMD